MSELYPILSRGTAGRAMQWMREIVAAGRGIGAVGSPPPGSRFILMYHRVLPRDARLPCPIQPGMFVTDETFERHLSWLKEHCEVIHLSRILDHEPSMKKAVAAITFDDGWRDTFDTAFPLLRRYDVPATVFLAAGFVGTSRWFWPERVAFLAAAGSDEPGNHLADRVDRLIEDMKGLDPGERERKIAEKEEALRRKGESLPDEPFTMTWDQVREMAEGEIEFGSHTTGHTILTEVPAGEAETELTGSKETIEKKLGRPCDLFCYPNGDLNDEIKFLAADAGYRIAVTTRPGWVTENADPLALPRVGVHEDMSRTGAQFAERIRRAGRAAAPVGRKVEGG